MSHVANNTLIESSSHRSTRNATEPWIGSIHVFKTFRQIASQVGRPSLGWLLLASLVGFTGCAEKEGIRVYKVAKQDDRSTSGSPSARAAVTREQQMLGAIVPDGQKYWVFKLLGDPEVVTKNRDEFLQIVNSLDFDTGRPTWQLSDGWTEKKLGGITYAELLKESDELRATVTELPVLDNWQDLVRANVNRWRGQLALEPRNNWESVETELEEVTSLSQGDNKAYFVSLTGTGSGQMSPGIGPFQGAAPPPDVSTDKSSQLPETKRKPEIEFAAAEGWSEQDVSSSPMRLAAFDIGPEGQGAELTVIPASGAIEGNMAIWFNQIGLDPNESALKKVIAGGLDVEVKDTQATIYDLGEGDAGESILVADIPWQEDESLFVKLKGSRKVVEAERGRFTEFVESIQW